MVLQADEPASEETDRSERALARSRLEATEELVLSGLRAQDEVDAAELQATDLRAMAKLREQLIAIIGHDLRNPLGAMMMGVGVLVARGNLNEEDARVAASVLTSGNRMRRMISQLLEFTRARLGGGLQLDRRPLNLGDVCQAVADEIELAASVHIDCTREGDLTGSWDLDRVTGVFANLVGNAVEHAWRGTDVTLRAYSDDADVVVDVSNEGHPIAPEMLAHIFEPFRRASQQQSKAGNLGLGLYIAHQVVLAHGGALVARSAGGRTTFTARLPRASPTPTR
jgi:signal transduction histidine kinase